jgi:hypothetical protein
MPCWIPRDVKAMAEHTAFIFGQTFEFLNQPISISSGAYLSIQGIFGLCSISRIEFRASRDIAVSGALKNCGEKEDRPL